MGFQSQPPYSDESGPNIYIPPVDRSIVKYRYPNWDPHLYTLIKLQNIGTQVLSYMMAFACVTTNFLKIKLNDP
jgi:hypothetical protein